MRTVLAKRSGGKAGCLALAMLAGGGGGLAVAVGSFLRDRSAAGFEWSLVFLFLFLLSVVWAANLLARARFSGDPVVWVEDGKLRLPTGDRPISLAAVSDVSFMEWSWTSVALGHTPGIRMPTVTVSLKSGQRFSFGTDTLDRGARVLAHAIRRAAAEAGREPTLNGGSCD